MKFLKTLIIHISLNFNAITKIIPNQIIKDGEVEIIRSNVFINFQGFKVVDCGIAKDDLTTLTDKIR